jgi:hypothetical protein
MARFSLALLVVSLTVSALYGDTTIVNEAFDGYADDSAFQAVWVPTVGNGSAPANPADVTSGILTTDAGLFPGIQGKAVDHIGATSSVPGMVNQYLPASGGPSPTSTVGPSETQSLFLSADIFESGTGNERMTVGLRNRTNTQNILELGVYNQVTCDATVAGCVPTTSPIPPTMPGYRPITGYSFRSAIFGGFGGDLVAEPNWQVFILPQELDRPADTDEVVTIGDVGAGWHRFMATITPTTITYEVDLFRDGLRNTSIVPDMITGIRPGTPGVDASITFEITTTANGFDSLRIGGPSGASSPGTGAMAFDNIMLKLIDVAAGVPGDYSGNGEVDAADYSTWRDHLGQTFALTNEDPGTTPGVVTSEDYDFWVSQFGMPGSGSGGLGGAAVPEPAAWMLTLAGVLASSVWSRRR